ncbi:MAG TPA: HD domain-containing phosphohydrolase [Chloroflexota bacterium]|nr:HD domain-containing phosphohydrolase [Chloroflexota bacterium]
MAVASLGTRRVYGTHTERLEAVLEVTRLLAAEVDLERLLPLCVHKTCEALNADRASVFLVDRERDELYTLVVSELEISEIRLHLGSGLAGHVAQSGDTLIIPDCYQDSRFDHSWDLRTGYRSRAMLVMPLRDISHAVIGVVQVINKLGPDGELLADAPVPPAFTEEDVENLSSIAASMTVAVRNALLVGEIRRMFTSTIEALAHTIDAKGQETAGHSQRVAATAALVARRMGLMPSEVERIRIAGLLHDFGKVFVSDRVLQKPGTLDDDERDEMRLHAAHTRTILDMVRFPAGYEDIPLMAGQHHERLDGSGYPHGHSGAQITLGGRLLTVADTYDALRMRRVYKPAYSIGESLALLRQEAAHGKLDSEAVETLATCIDEIERTVGPLRPV